MNGELKMEEYNSVTGLKHGFIMVMSRVLKTHMISQARVTAITE